MYITLSSDLCMNNFPDNNCHNFRNNIDPPIRFSPGAEVALIDFFLTYNVCDSDDLDCKKPIPDLICVNIDIISPNPVGGRWLQVLRVVRPSPSTQSFNVVQYQPIDKFGDLSQISVNLTDTEGNPLRGLKQHSCTLSIHVRAASNGYEAV